MPCPNIGKNGEATRQRALRVPMEITASSIIDRRWADAPSSTHTARWSAAASLMSHIALGIGIVLSPAPRPKSEPPSGVTVRLLTRREFETATRPAPPPAPEKLPSATAPRNEQSAIAPSAQSSGAQPNAMSRSGAMVRATELFSAGVLAENGSRQVRETLPLLAKADRVMQLCNIEAVEQICRSQSELQPDYVVADAMTEAELHNSSLDAEGGAFRSEGRWYRLKYRCTVTANLAAVASFEFLVGEAIPKREWRNFHLTPEGKSSD